MSTLAAVRLTRLLVVIGLAACSAPAQPPSPPNAPAANQPSSPKPAAPTVATRLCQAAAAGDFAMVKALLDQGADANAVDPLDPRRNTPLIAAVEPGHFTVVRLLLSRGADVATLNAQGKSATDIAREKNYEAIVVLLGMRKASEVELADPVAQPLDPAKLDPGALIKKIEEITEHPAAGGPAPTASAPAKAPAPEPAPQAAPVAAPAAATAPETDKAKGQEPVPEAQQRELCAQVQTAMAQLEGADDAELEGLGLTREAALAQLQATLGDTCK